MVVDVPEEVPLALELDHGCHTKTAMRIAIRTTMTMPSAAAPPPESLSCTTTGPSAIRVLAPFCCSAAVIPSGGKPTRASGEGPPMWAACGLVLALFSGLFAWSRSKRPTENYYAGEVYGINRATHRRYAYAAAAFCAVFAAALVVHQIPTVPLLAVYALIAVLYFSSFARGFSDEEH